jgi:hypothetical protein
MTLLHTALLVAALAATEYHTPVPDHALIAWHAHRAGTAHGVCPRVLVAMAWRESRFRADAVGDQGRSCGAWQIRHDIRGRPPCVAAKHPGTAAKWAARELVRLDRVCSADPVAAYNAGCRGARMGRGTGYARSVRRMALGDTQ